MKRQRRVGSAALCGTVAVIGWVAAGPAGLDTFTLESDQTPNEVSAVARVEQVETARAITLVERGGACVADTESGIATFSEPRPTRMLANALLASLKTSDPVRNDAGEVTGSIGIAEKAIG